MIAGARRLLLAAALAVVTTAALAQAIDRPDPIRIPADGSPLRIEHIDDIPRQLRAAIDRRADCRLDETLLRDLPIVVFRPGRQWPMAIVTCSSIIAYSHAYVFERSIGREPVRVSFPVATPDGGFVATEHPGVIRWDADAKLLIATEHNDVCPSPILRHIYRQGGGELSGFVLVKIERGQACRRDQDQNWTLIWEAQPWPAKP